MLRDFVDSPPREQLFEVAAKFLLLQFFEDRAADHRLLATGALRGTDVVADPKSLFELREVDCAFGACDRRLFR